MSSVPLDQVRFVLGRLATSPAEVHRMAALLDGWRDRDDPIAGRLLALAEACAICDAPLSREELRGEVSALIDGTSVTAEDLMGPCRSRVDAAAAIVADSQETAEDADEALDRGLQEWDEETSGTTGFKLSRRIFGDLADHFEGWWSSSRRITMGTFGILSGSPGEGKTTAAIGFAQSAIDAGVHVMFYQIDVDRGRFMRDFAAMMIGLDRNAACADGHIRAIAEVRERIRTYLSLPSVSGDAMAHPTVMIREIRRWHRSLPPGAQGLVIVDYLQRIDDGHSEEHDLAYRMAKRLADLSTKTSLCILGLSQQTKGAQMDFAKSVAEAARTQDAGTYGDRLLASIDRVAAHAAAGGDIRRHPHVLFALASVDGRTVVACGKSRSKAWGTEARDRRAVLVDLADNGRWSTAKDNAGRPLSIEAFAAGVLAHRKARRTAEKAGMASVPPTGGEPNHAPRRRQRFPIMMEDGSFHVDAPTPSEPASGVVQADVQASTPDAPATTEHRRRRTTSRRVLLEGECP